MKKFSTNFSKTSRYVVKRVLPIVKQGVALATKAITSTVDFLFDHGDQIWLGIKIVGGVILLIVSPPLLIVILVWKFFFNRGTPNDVCPKCDSHNIKVVKSSRWNHLMEQNVAIWVPGAKISKPLNVCKSCGFSWDSR